MKDSNQLLKDFIKSNQTRRQQLATKAGFNTPDEYKEYLVSLITGALPISAGGNSTLVKPTIHLVDLLDSSGSMAGGKYTNATRGITEGLNEFRLETQVSYTYSLVEFVQSNKTIEHQYVGSLNLHPSFYGAIGGNTPLYYTLANTLTKLQQVIPNGEKVLVKVYTDGGNNTMFEYANTARNLINQLKDSYTVTLVGPASEVQQAIRELGLDESNTLAVEDNARGFETAFKMSRGATMSYTASVLKGEDVSVGFYSKKVGKL